MADRQLTRDDATGEAQAEWRIVPQIHFLGEQDPDWLRRFKLFSVGSDTIDPTEVDTVPLDVTDW